MKLLPPSLHVIAAAALLTALLGAVHRHAAPNALLPRPGGGTIVSTHQREGENDEALEREAWIERMHLAAPGTDWRAIEQTRREQARRENPEGLQERTAESFAGGLLQGEWFDRGSYNLAGSIAEVKYDSIQNSLYAISAGGTLWKSDTSGSNWTAKNRTTRFNSDILQITSNYAGGRRILAAEGKTIKYSDNDGTSWTSATGFNFYDGWGYPISLVALNDTAKTLYYLVKTWDAGPWAARFWLFRSTNRGQSFSQIATFVPGTSGYWTRTIAMWSPYNSTQLFLLNNGQTLYAVNGASMTVLNTNATLPTGVENALSGHKSNTGTIRLYALANNKDLYQSVDNGASWTLQSSLPEDSWTGIEVSLANPDILYFGGVDCYRSLNAGATWNRINYWYQYYSNPSMYFHADIMDIAPFIKPGGSEMVFVSNHGGVYKSGNQLASNQNISLQKLQVGQYYDSRTNNAGTRLYIGSQDQGFQYSYSTGGTGPITCSQLISGDYGYMTLTGNETGLWMVYPGGVVSYWSGANTNNPQYQTDVTIAECHSWIPACEPAANAAANEVWIAGGHLAGSSGSHLIKLAWTGNSISTTELSYDFYSASGGQYLSAIACTPVAPGYIYAGTDQGKFFYSADNGNSWTQSPSFNGPAQHYFYGSKILPSRIQSGLLYFAGSGYSNPGVYRSSDHGQTWTAVANGLPATLVYDLAFNSSETLLFAATESGPYVYVIAQNQWYPMLGNYAPDQTYWTVEYVAAVSSVRFGTYGRGIWDFKISQQPLPIQLSAFEAERTATNSALIWWTTASEKDNAYFDIERSADGVRFESIGRVFSKGNAAFSQYYSVQDYHPFPGQNYYRLRQTDRNGQVSYSDIRTLWFDQQTPVRLWPSVLAAGQGLYFEGDPGNTYDIRVFDSNGQPLLRTQIGGQLTEIEVGALPAGVYYYNVRASGGKGKSWSGKLIRL